MRLLRVRTLLLVLSLSQVALQQRQLLLPKALPGLASLLLRGRLASLVLPMALSQLLIKMLLKQRPLVRWRL
ncbi:MAG: hypothetical protein EBT05_09530 [Betaproteobacteria bacterium]|nr:hypothetical protein [Betaproteobacteria bacterium]